MSDWISDVCSSVLRGRKLYLFASLSTVACYSRLSLTHLSQAWVLKHPSVSSAIIGPRPPEQLADVLGAADVPLDPTVLDRIDELVPPGVTLNPADAGHVPAGLDPTARRRPTRRIPT